MTVPTSGSIADVSFWLAQFDPTVLPAGLCAAVQAATARISVVDRLAQIAELLWANPTGLPAAQTLAVQCIYICRLNGWQTLADPRGWGMEQALRRTLGETAPPGSSWPDPSADPAALQQFVISG